MMKQLTFWIPAILVVACSGPTEERFSPADASLIRQRTQEFKAAFNSKELEKVLAFYRGESSLMPPNAPTLRGLDAIREFYTGLFKQGATELVMESQDIGGHGRLAYEAGTYSLNRRPPAGPSTRDRGKYIFIWRNHNDVWSIEYTIWSSDLPEFVPIGPGR
jgi:ketosteroid isomerase-like protein